MFDQTWYFDRLGENLNVPPVLIPSRRPLVQALVDHVRVHLIVDKKRPIRIERRATGGFDVVDRTTGFVYGQARTNRNFGDKSFPILPPAVKRRNSPTKKAGNE